MAVIADLQGCSFGRLTVVSRAANKSYSTGAVWSCRCECGAVVTVISSYLVNGNTKSCGCLRRESARTHGLTHSREYHAWGAAIARCKPTGPYGQLGIRVCLAWRRSFEAFLAHVGPAPSGLHQIDRIDSAGHYEPGNVRWSTPTEQANNKRNNHRLIFDGDILTIAEWARRLGVPRERIKSRLARGWSVERALTEPFVTDRRDVCRAAAHARWSQSDRPG